jgi:hypothetical protein
MAQHDDMQSAWTPFDSFDGDDFKPFDSFDGCRPRTPYILIGLGQETDRAVLIKVKDPGALARSQGGAATFAQGIAPAFIEGKVYDGMRDQLQTQLKAKGIDAEVSVVQPGQWRAADGSHIASDFAFMLGGAGIATFFLWLAFGRKK